MIQFFWLGLQRLIHIIHRCTTCLIKNYTIDETTEKYQNVIDQLQFLTKEHNYQINRVDGLGWPKDTPYYIYTLTKNMLKHED